MEEIFGKNKKEKNMTYKTTGIISYIKLNDNSNDENLIIKIKSELTYKIAGCADNTRYNVFIDEETQSGILIKEYEEFYITKKWLTFISKIVDNGKKCIFTIADNKKDIISMEYSNA